MVTVAITGVGGLIGRELVRALDEVDDVDRILGLDLDAPTGLSSSKLLFRQVDIRDPSFADHLREVDKLVHLAFWFDPDRDEAAMRSVNVEGTQNVFQAAVQAGVGQIVYPSSAVVYGAHPDNDFPLTEQSPLRANPDFNYAEHKLDVERWLAEWEPEGELTVTVLRPAIVAGPGADNFITRILEGPRFITVTGHRPPLQYVHVEDVASAIIHVMVRELEGAYNVSAEGWLSTDEITAIMGRKRMDVPEEVAFTMTDRLWKAGLGEAPSGIVHYLMHPWVVSVDKLTSTGWQPKHSNRDALAELAEEHRDMLNLFGLRVRRSALLGAGAIGLGTVAVGVGRAAWRWFRDR